MEEQGLLFDFTRPGLPCGVDEAGRGALAGPVAAAACVLPPDFPSTLLDDSKKLTEARRFEIEPIIKEKALAWAVCFASAERIGEINILKATLETMASAMEEVAAKTRVSLFLVDGNKAPRLGSDPEAEIRTIVKGDAKEPSIMAASILAKTARDRLMMDLDKKFPGYGWAVNKGYGTLSHTRAILEKGPSPEHRALFVESALDTYRSKLTSRRS